MCLANSDDATTPIPASPPCSLSSAPDFPVCPARPADRQPRRPRRQALTAEQRGDWLDACRWYDEAYRRDRTRPIARTATSAACASSTCRPPPRPRLPRGPRPAHARPGASTSTTRSSSSSPPPTSTARRATSASCSSRASASCAWPWTTTAFRREHLAGVRPDRLKAFRDRLDEWVGRKVASAQEAREEVLADRPHGPADGLGQRSGLLAVMALEFACGACNALDEYTLFLTPSHHADVQAMLRGRNVGVGIELAVIDGKLRSPASTPRARRRSRGCAARPRRGHRQPAVENLTVELIAERLRGEIGTTLKLEVLSPGQMERCRGR